MKILIIGGSSLLGSRIAKFSSHTHQTYWTYLTNPFIIKNTESYKLNIKNYRDVLTVITKINPDVVIHVAYQVNADLCEKEYEKCYEINVKGTANIVDACDKIGCKMVFISSSYVFDGEKGFPYVESDETNPINKYGEMKELSEKLVSSLKNWLIVRTSVLYGWNVYGQRLNYVAWIVDTLESGREINIVNDQIGNPTFVNNIAQAILKFIEKNKNGIYNIVGKDFMTRYEFASKIVQIFNLNPSLISPITSKNYPQVAKRPKNDSLSIKKAEKDLYFHFCDAEEGLKMMKNRIREDEEKWMTD